jgi:hypothetical protein
VGVHERAAVGHLTDHAGRLEDAQGLAHRGAAHAELLGELLLAQPASQRDVAGEDRRVDLRGELVDEGSRRRVAPDRAGVLARASVAGGHGHVR